MIGIDNNSDPMDAQFQHSDASIDAADTLEAETPSDNQISQGGEIDQLLSSYDYELPPDRIAQTPLAQRDRSRLLVVDSPTHHAHRLFYELPEILQPQDLLVLNNTRVIPARLFGSKSTGAPIEVLLLEERQKNCWLALVKPGRRLKPGAKILFEPRQAGDSSEPDGEPSPLPPLSATVVARDEATSGRLLKFDIPDGVSWVELLEQYGHLALPPYISNSQAAPEQYQTVYAHTPGAIAAPTAGLHFTDELLQKCNERGIQQAFVTLHVGVGTFRPVEVDHITEHKMHGEWLEVPPATVEKIRETKASGGRVIAVGTTVVRALEGAATNGELQPFQGKTELFIYPGYQWNVIDGLVTNFHLPRSTLMMMLSAMIGRERLLALYQDAIAQNYRFYSFGDAMLILPEATTGARG